MNSLEFNHLQEMIVDLRLLLFVIIACHFPGE